MRTERRRAGGRRGCEAKHRLDVAGRLGVVREPGQIGSASRWVDERGERPAMQIDPSVERDRFLDGETPELVPERDGRRLGHEHARHQALLERLNRFCGERLQQPELGPRRHGCHRLKQPPRPSTEARGTGEDRVPHRVRNLIGARGERLDDEERIAGGLAIQLARIDAVRLGQLRDRRRRERSELQPSNRPARCQLAQHDPQRVRPGELVVAITHHDQGRNGLDPAHQ